MKGLWIFFSLILILMTGLITWASMEKSMTFGYSFLFSERWGITTLADAACAFLIFYVWVFYKERSALSRVVWFALIMFFGNTAMAIYALNQLRKLPAHAGIEDFLLREKGALR